MTINRRSLLKGATAIPLGCIRSAEFSASAVSPPLDREWMADDYLKKFAPIATHLSSPTSATNRPKADIDV